MSSTTIEASRNAEQSPKVTGSAIYGDANSLDLGDKSLSLEIHTNPATALAAWEELEEIAPGSFYQTRRFLIPWVDTIGAARGISPFFVVVHNNAGLALAILPLGMRQSGGLRIVEFLGGKDSNSNMGLFRPGISINASGIQSLFERVRQMATHKPDVAILQNQPLEWDGNPNPLALLDHRPSPSLCHACQLTASGDEYRNNNLSKDYRKKLRAKQRKLAEMGEVKFFRAADADQAQTILDAFYQQKLKRFDDQNIKSEFDLPETRNFMARAAISRINDRGASLNLYALSCGGKIVATFGGSVHQKRFYGMFNSFDADPAYARHSPGDILLSHLIDDACSSGLTGLDLGLGESRYKNIWCNQSQSMFDTIIGFSPSGRAFAAMAAIRQGIKRRVKQSTWAWPLAMKLRAKLRLR